jgi:hypothetical protein
LCSVIASLFWKEDYIAVLPEGFDVKLIMGSVLDN